MDEIHDMHNDYSNITTKIISNSKYDHNKKLELVHKINKIKKKEYLMNIFQIITIETKDYTENNNGVFIFFHNLPDNIYEKVDAYVNMIYKLHTKSLKIKNVFNSDISENIIENSDTIEIDNNIDKDFSNKEKMIMRRKKYEEYISQNQKYK